METKFLKRQSSTPDKGVYYAHSGEKTVNGYYQALRVCIDDNHKSIILDLYTENFMTACYPCTQQEFEKAYVNTHSELTVKLHNLTRGTNGFIEMVSGGNEE
jgi:hypothetical protein